MMARATFYKYRTESACLPECVWTLACLFLMTTDFLFIASGNLCVSLNVYTHIFTNRNQFVGMTLLKWPRGIKFKTEKEKNAVDVCVLFYSYRKLFKIGLKKKKKRLIQI